MQGGGQVNLMVAKHHSGLYYSIDIEIMMPCISDNILQLLTTNRKKYQWILQGEVSRTQTTYKRKGFASL